MSLPPEVVVLGDVNVDVEACCTLLPDKGQCVRPSSLVVHAGGAAANTALGLARLGRRVALLGRVGRDPLASTPLGALARAGVDLAGVQHDSDAPTGLIYTVLTPDGARSTVAHQGANTRYELDDVGMEAIRGARILHVNGYAFLAEPQGSAARLAVRLAVERGVEVTLDPCLTGPPGALEELRRLLGDVAAVFPNLAEGRALAGVEAPREVLEALATRCSGLVALKLGASGSSLARAGRSVSCAALEVGVVSTVGAGDAFAAAVLAGLLDDLELETLALIGNAAGAMAVMQAAAGEAAPTPAALVEFLSSRHWPDARARSDVENAVRAAERWAARLAPIARGGDAV